MNRIYSGVGIIILMCSSACSGDHGSVLAARGGAVDKPVLTGLAGTACADILLVQTGSELRLSLPPSSAPRVMELELPASQEVAEWEWSGQTGEVLTALVPTPTGAELAVAPLSATAAPALELTIGLAESVAGRTASQVTPPGDFVQDLRADSSSGAVGALSWIQVLPGDYNFDGRVSLEDLPPLTAWWGRSVDRQAAGARQLPAYWMDGNGDGRVDDLDRQLIHLYYGFKIAGYAIRRNCCSIGGGGSDEIIVPQVRATRRKGLPSTFSFPCSGNFHDCWHVIPIALGGPYGDGAVIGGGKLVINIEFEGDCAPREDPDVPRFETRVIDPIELVDDIDLPVTIDPSDTEVLVTNVPRGRQLQAEISYIPGGSFTGPERSVSAANRALGTAITTGLVFSMPANTNFVRIDGLISLRLTGTGLKIQLRTATSADNGPRVVSLVELDYSSGTLRRDTDNDGRLEDELVLIDANRDMVSDALRAQLRELPILSMAQPATRVRGTILSVNFDTAEITLGNVTTAGSMPLPAQLALSLAENTRWGCTTFPHQLQPGKQLAATVYPAMSASGAFRYLAGYVQLADPAWSGFSFAPAEFFNQGGGRLLRWTNPAGTRANYLVRSSSPYAPRGPGNAFQYSVPAVRVNWEQPLPITQFYLDTEAEWSQHYVYDLFGQNASGGLSYLGSTK